MVRQWDPYDPKTGKGNPKHGEKPEGCPNVVIDGVRRTVDGFAAAARRRPTLSGGGAEVALTGVSLGLQKLSEKIQEQASLSPAPDFGSSVSRGLGTQDPGVGLT